MRIRLKDVGERAGVSEATVSRVMNGRAGVNEHTRNQVLRVLAEMGHEPAPSTRTSKFGLVGLIVPELDNPIFPLFAQCIESRLGGSGYAAVLGCVVREGVQESEYIDMLLEREVAGIISVSGLLADTAADHGLYVDLVARGMPVVFINGYSDRVAASFFSCDDRFAVASAVRHLVALGHSRIGFITGPDRYVPAQRKLEGFRRTMKDLCGGADPNLVEESVFSVEGGHAAAQHLIERGATAIVAGSDLMALGAIRAARDIGYDVPGDVSVVGFDDTSLMAFTDPPLTTVRQPVLAMSLQATKALLDLINGVPTSAREYLFRTELVVRGSTAVAPVARSHGTLRHVRR